MGTINSNLALYSALVGWFLPLLISVIQQERWREQYRAIVAFAACVAAGLGTAALEGDFTTKGVLGSLLIVAGLAKTSYESLWKPTGLASKIEAATSPSPAPPPTATVALSIHPNAISAAVRSSLIGDGVGSAPAVPSGADDPLAKAATEPG